MTEAGVMRRLVEALPGDGGMVYQFETSVDERYAVSRPPMSQAQEAELLEVLREILAEDGGPE